MRPESLRRWRADMGWSQRKAASELGITLKTYQQLERGQSWATGEPVLPCLRTALACAALRARLPPEGACKD